MVLARRGMRGGGSRLGLASRPQVFSVPLWVPAAGNFGDASTNLPSAVDPDPTNVAAYAGVSFFPSIWTSWGGGCFASELGSLGSLLMFSGGNRSYDGNEIVRFDVASRLFSLQTSPAAYSSLEEVSGDNSTTNVNVSTSGGWPNATPFPIHTYGGVCFVPAAGGGGTNGSWVHATHWQNNVNITKTVLWRCNLATGAWTSRELQAVSVYANYLGMCYDSTRGGIWLLFPTTQYGLQRLAFYSYNTDTLTEVTMSGTGTSSGAILPDGMYAVMPEFVPSKNCIVLPKSGTGLSVVCIDLSATVIGSNNTADVFNVTQSGTKCPCMWDASATPQSLSGFKYCSQDGALYVLDQYAGASGCVLYKLTPPTGAVSGTWTWSNETLTANAGETLALRANTSGTVGDKMLFGRIAYVPGIKSFVISDASNLKAQALRPAAFT
jgi:hypothetical protein